MPILCFWLKKKRKNRTKENCKIKWHIQYCVINVHIYFIYVKICLCMQRYVYICIKISVFCVYKHKNINKWIKSFHEFIVLYHHTSIFPSWSLKKKKFPAHILVQGNPRSLSLLVAYPPSCPKTLEPHECQMWIVHVCVGWSVCMYVCVHVNRCWETISK